MRSRLRRIGPTAIAFAVPFFLVWFGGVALAESSPSPAASLGSASSPRPAGGDTLPGDPANGEKVYLGPGGCVTCHGANLGGGIGAKLRPIDGGAANLQPEYLIDVITNGKKGSIGVMPARGGQSADKVSDQDVKDLAAFIISQNRLKGPVGYTPRELAISDIQIVLGGIFLMVVLTWLLSRYNMRWIARRAGRK